METRKEIDQRYIDEANQLQAEFFDIADIGKPNQHRVLKGGKLLEEYNYRQGRIWQRHEGELLAKGFIEPIAEPEPVRDLTAEIDELKARVEELEKVRGVK